MTLHYNQDYQCVKCETYFLPFQGPVTVCPECGEPNLQAEDFRDIVKVLVEANAAHRKMFGHFTPPAYGVFSLVDHYVYYSANIFDMYMERQAAKAQVIEEVIAHESPTWQEHLRELLYQLFEHAEHRSLFQAEQPPDEHPVEDSQESRG
ncbi:MAG: FmdB family zinc ribbon protein [Armatimonadota bacterium]